VIPILNLRTTSSRVYALTLRRSVLATADGLPVSKSKCTASAVMVPLVRRGVPRFADQAIPALLQVLSYEVTKKRAGSGPVRSTVVRLIVDSSQQTAHDGFRQACSVTDLDVMRIPRLDSGMRIPECILKCVGFLGDPILTTSENEEINPQSTAFFVSLKSGVQNRFSYCYVVTAKHASKNVKGPLWLAANTASGRILIAPDLEKKHWYDHPTDRSADVVVTPIVIPPGLDIITIECGKIFAPKTLPNQSIGIGDDVFFPGLFTDAFGKMQNSPVVRQGTIAMFPKEQVQVDFKDGASEPMDVYVVEARSINGLSGSPVFVRETAYVSAKNASGSRTMAECVAGFRLLGLMSGHWDLTTHPFSVNSGLGFVVPAHKIIETLDHPELLHIRIENEKTLVEQHRGHLLRREISDARTSN
jgi:hypothetical protein